MVQRTLGGVTSLRGTIVPLRRATHKIQMPRASITARATQTNTNTSGISYQALNDAGGVYLVSSQEEQLNAEVLPELDAKGVQLLLVSVGTKERGLEFVEKTGFPADRLLADPDSHTYEALSMKKGLLATFFSPQTPLAIWDDIKSGRISTLKEVLKTWTKTPLWHPPKSDQALQQGGVVIFEGNEPTWVHRDPSTGAHADMEEVIRVATRGL